MDDQARRAAGRRRRTVTACLALFALAAFLGVAAPAAHAATVTCAVAPSTVVFGSGIVVSGTVDPAVAAQDVAIDLDGVVLTTVQTDAAGAFSAAITPDKGGQLTARLTADGSVSAPVSLEVKPRLVSTRVLSKVPFGFTQIALRLAPASYRGTISYTVRHNARTVSKGSLRCAGERTLVRFKTPGVGTFKVVFTFAASGGLAERTTSTVFSIAGHRLAQGSSGAQVEALLRRLAFLRFRIPGVSKTLSFNATESIMAFQKAYRLPRTYVFDADDWRKIDTAKVIAPRSKTPKLHIEVDKTRQILMVVKNGAVYGTIAISSGATGNTPEGWHSILWKSPATSSWLGAGVLYRTMTFHGNFAIHGYFPVPPYPASHGCVREPNWVANWTYVNSYVGEKVYVYH
jgi:N-acetylmuramoyl-L-alanine amidase